MTHPTPKLLVAIGLVIALGVACVVLPRPARPFDFDGDGKADLVWVNFSDGNWYRAVTGDLVLAGTPTDRPVPGDYDGNGVAEMAVVNESGDWITAPGASPISFPPPPKLMNEWATSEVMPVQGDYDVAGTTQPAWYRDSDATWFIRGHDPIQFGQVGSPSANGQIFNQDIPVPADYDGDGRTDIATFSPLTAEWRVRSSRDGSESVVTFGATASFPFPADFDGNGKAERATWDFSGTWTIDGRAPFVFQSPTTGQHLAAPADYDGDGKVEVAEFDNDNPRHLRTELGLDATFAGSPGSYDLITPVTFPARLQSDILRITYMWRCQRDPLSC